MSLDGKIGIVTGGTGGLGLEIARELARNGATVIITSRKKSKLQKACNIIGKNSYGIELDVIRVKSIGQFIKRISKDFNTVDVLVNNAGFPFERKIWFKKVHDITDTELLNILQVDLIGSFRVSKEVLKIMMEKKERSDHQYRLNSSDFRTFMRFAVLYSKSGIDWLGQTYSIRIRTIQY